MLTAMDRDCGSPPTPSMSSTRPAAAMRSTRDLSRRYITKWTPRRRCVLRKRRRRWSRPASAPTLESSPSHTLVNGWRTLAPFHKVRPGLHPGVASRLRAGGVRRRPGARLLNRGRKRRIGAERCRFGAAGLATGVGSGGASALTICRMSTTPTILPSSPMTPRRSSPD